MKQFFLISFIAFFYHINCAQSICKDAFKTDSCVLGPSNKKELVDMIDVKIKNNYQVQFIKHQQKKYLKLIITDNLGFGKTGPLLLISNTKQFYLKSMTLIGIDKTSGYFIFDLNPQYLSTIKENGLTNMTFNNSEFSIPKQDSESIKKAANCFFEAVMPK